MIEVMVKPFGKGSILTGATCGEDHHHRFRNQLRSEADLAENQLMIIDFAGLEFVSASYLKAAVYPFISLPLSGPAGGEVYIFPILRNLPSASADELKILCASERIPCLSSVKASKRELIKAKIYGVLERTLKTALDGLQRLGCGTAAEIAALYPADVVNLTAWNNRLAELFRLRLATRLRHGRFWHYRPTAKEIIYG